MHTLLLFSHWVMSNSSATPWTVARQDPLSVGFPRQEYWCGLPFLTPRDLSNPFQKLTHWKRPWCWERLKAGGEGDDRDEMDEMVGWHHWFNGHEFVQAPGDCEGQGSLECCSPWGHKESDTTEWLNDEQLQGIFPIQRSNLFSCVSCTGRQILYHWASQKAPKEAK